CGAGASVVAVVAGASCILREQDDERDHEAEQTRRFTKREAQKQVGRLRGSRTRVAQCALEVAAEHVTDADTGAHERDTGKARADHFCRSKFHNSSSFLM